MANISYKLFDPSTNSYVEFDDGSDTKITSASKAEIEDYATKNGYKVNYLESAADYAMPKFGMGNIGITTPETDVSVPSATPQSTVMSPLEESAAEVSPLGAIGGGILSGVTLDWRDEIFGKDERGVKPAEAEAAAYPRLYGGSKFIGALAPNIVVDLLLARAGMKNPTGIAATGGAVTGAVESLGSMEDSVSDMTMEDALGISGSMLGGAVGGAAGQKILGPLLKAGGRYLGSKIPSLGIPSFPTGVAEETIEGQMTAAGKEAEKAMLQKSLAEKGIERREARLEQIRPEKAAAEEQRVKLTDKSMKDMFAQQMDVEKLKPSAKEYSRLNQLIAREKDLAKSEFDEQLLKMKPDLAVESVQRRMKMDEKQAQSYLDNLYQSRKKPIGFESGTGISTEVKSVPLTAAEQTELQQLRTKVINYDNAKNQMDRSAAKRALDLLAEQGDEAEPPIPPDFSSEELASIMRKPLQELNGEELAARISRIGGKFLKQREDIYKLEEAIAKSNATIAAKRQMYNDLREKLIKVDGLKDYLKRFKGSALGGAVGSQAGIQGMEYGMTPSGGRR